MLPQYLIVFFVAAASASPAPAPAPVPVPAPAPATHLEKRADWYAKDDGEECRIDWSGRCYEYCKAYTPASCKNKKVYSRIEGADKCPWLQKRCKCWC